MLSRNLRLRISCGQTFKHRLPYKWTATIGHQYLSTVPTLPPSKSEMPGPKSKTFYIRAQQRIPGTPTTADGKPMLYQGTQKLTIRLVTGACTLNLFYWSASLYETILLRDPSISIADQLAALSPSFSLGSPAWVTFGYFATGLMLFCLRIFANRSIHTVYENTETGRIGFRVHNMLGMPGKCYEAYPHNVTFGHETSRTSLMPLRIAGLDQMLLLDRDGEYYDSGRLFDRLEQSSAGVQTSTQQPDDKEQRILKVKEQATLVRSKYNKKSSTR